MRSASFNWRSPSIAASRHVGCRAMPASKPIRPAQPSTNHTTGSVGRPRLIAGGMIELFSQFFHTFAEAFEVGVDLQGFDVTADGIGKLAEVRVSMTHASPRAEMTRHALNHLLAVGYGFAVALGQTTHDR